MHNHYRYLTVRFVLVATVLLCEGLGAQTVEQSREHPQGFDPEAPALSKIDPLVATDDPSVCGDRPAFVSARAVPMKRIDAAADRLLTRAKRIHAKPQSKLPEVPPSRDPAEQRLIDYTFCLKLMRDTTLSKQEKSDILADQIKRTREDAPASNPPPSETKGFVVENVFFATDRKLRPGKEPSVYPDFIAERANAISYGTVAVSIPQDHKMGEMENPVPWKFEFRADPTKHVVVLQTTVLSKETLFASLQRVANESSAKSLLLFVHGYNTGFYDAARRTAQMAYDLGFKGSAGFFSWPSQNLSAGYVFDEQSIIDAEPHLEQFLRDLLTTSGASSVYLVAHSMGNRGLSRALLSLARTNPDDVKRIKEVILAAPDIGTTEFTEQIAPGLSKLGAPVTLYASSHDTALYLSKGFHGGPRAGDSGTHIVVVDGIETIDASNVDTDFISTGHSYYGDGRSVLADMWYLVNGDLRPNKRCCLTPQPSANSPKWWVFHK